MTDIEAALLAKFESLDPIGRGLVVDQVNGDNPSDVDVNDASSVGNFVVRCTSTGREQALRKSLDFHVKLKEWLEAMVTGHLDHDE